MEAKQKKISLKTTFLKIFFVGLIILPLIILLGLSFLKGSFSFFLALGSREKGELVGQITGYTFIFSFFWFILGYIFQGKKNLRTLARSILIILVIVLGLSSLQNNAEASETVLNLDLLEKVEGKKTFLVHPSLRFQIEHPGNGYVLKKKDPLKGVKSYIYINSEASKALTVSLSEITENKNIALEQHLQGIINGMQKNSKKAGYTFSILNHEQESPTRSLLRTLVEDSQLTVVRSHLIEKNTKSYIVSISTVEAVSDKKIGDIEYLTKSFETF